MKKLLLLGISIPFMTLAQVGINTSNPYNSAALQVESSNKGILIPRVNITNTTSQSPISVTPKDGLLVYNSGTSQGTSQTLYFWDSPPTLEAGHGINRFISKKRPRLLI
jgi:hypothetical protein